MSVVIEGILTRVSPWEVKRNEIHPFFTPLSSYPFVVIIKRGFTCKDPVSSSHVRSILGVFFNKGIKLCAIIK